MREPDLEFQRMYKIEKNIKKFSKLCTELTNLVIELNADDIEVIYHLNSDKLELTDGSTTFVMVDAPLVTMWD